MVNPYTPGTPEYDLYQEKTGTQNVAPVKQQVVEQVAFKPVTIAPAPLVNKPVSPLSTQTYQPVTTPLPKAPLVSNKPAFAPAPVIKPQFQSVFTNDQANQLKTMAAIGGAITITPELGELDLPVKAIVVGAVLAGATGLAIASNKEALKNNIGIISQMVQDAESQGASAFQKFSDGVWVNAHGQVQGFDVRTKQWIENVLQPDFEKIEKIIVPKIESGVPLQQAISEVEGVIKLQPFRVPEGLQLNMPRIEDYILVNPLPNSQKAADILMMAVNSARNSLSYLQNIPKIGQVDLSGSFEQINNILDQINSGKMTQAMVKQGNQALTNIDQTIKDIAVQAGGQESILQRHASAAVADVQTKLQELWQARHTYVQSLNPSPVTGSNIDKKTLAAIGTYKVAQVIADNQNEVSSKPSKTKAPYAVQPIPVVAVPGTDTSIDKPQTKTQGQTATKTAVKQAVQTADRIAPKSQTQTKTQTQTLTQTATKTHNATHTRTATKDLARSATDAADLTDTINLPNLELPQIEFTDKNGRKIKLTNKNGVVAWKQGFVYVLKWHPYDKKLNTHYSLEPVPGVIYATGIGSVAKSIVQMYGEIPKGLYFDMGFENVEIQRREGQQPLITFARNTKARGGGGQRVRKPIRKPVKISREEREVREMITGM